MYFIFVKSPVKFESTRLVAVKKKLYVHNVCACHTYTSIFFMTLIIEFWLVIRKRFTFPVAIDFCWFFPLVSVSDVIHVTPTVRRLVNDFERGALFTRPSDTTWSYQTIGHLFFTSTFSTVFGSDFNRKSEKNSRWTEKQSKNSYHFKFNLILIRI